MKAVEIQGAFGIENLEVVARPDLVPGPLQVVVKVRAASLNYRDLMMVRGLYNPRQKLPLVPLSDGVGEVVLVGSGVTSVKVGERVCPIFAQGWLSGEPAREMVQTTLGGPLDGALASHMLVSADAVVRVPAHLSDEEAATLPCAAVTAWHALVEKGAIKAGDTVVVQGTGGVSLFALQFAKMHGARVIATSSSDAKLERVRALGADELIHYGRTTEWAKAVRELTGGRGADHIVDVGGGGTFEQSLAASRPGGTISVIGVLGGPAGNVNLRPILMNALRVQGVFVGSRAMFENMNRAITQAEMHPVIDRVFSQSEARSAFEHMAGASHFGKIVLRADL